MKTTNIIQHNGVPCVRAKVVILPAEDEPTNGLQPLSVYSKPITKGGLMCPKSGAEARRLVKMGCQAYHLYFTTDEEIKEGDWFINTGNHNIIMQAKKDGNSLAKEYCKKIIATTDPKLIESGVSEIPTSFIEEYCKAGGINEVYVECEGYKVNGMIDETTSYKLKVNPTDNTITTRLVEEKMYSLEDMIKLAKKVNETDFAFPIENWDIKKWIKENL